MSQPPVTDKPKPRRPPYYCRPEQRDHDLLDAGLNVACVGLDSAAWAVSSAWVLDGLLGLHLVRGIRGWTSTRQETLVEAGAWRLHGDTVELVDYLSVNRSRAEIAAKRSHQIELGRKGGMANRQPRRRGPDGKLLGTEAPASDAGSNVGTNAGTYAPERHALVAEHEAGQSHRSPSASASAVRLTPDAIDVGEDRAEGAPSAKNEPIPFPARREVGPPSGMDAVGFPCIECRREIRAHDGKQSGPTHANCSKVSHRPPFCSRCEDFHQLVQHCAS